MVSHLNSFRYVEMAGEFIETPYQAFEVISHAAIEDVYAIQKTSKVPHKMASLKDAKEIIEKVVVLFGVSFLTSPVNLTSLVWALLHRVKGLFAMLELEDLCSVSAIIESML